MIDPYVQSILGEMERVLFITRKHWSLLLFSLVTEFLICAAIIVAVTLIGIFAPVPYKNYLVWLAVLVIFPLISAMRDFMEWRSTQYIVTNHRVIQTTGVFNKSITDSSLEKVNDVKMYQSFIGRMFGYGDIEIMTASEAGVNLFKHIGDPIHFKTAMLNAKERMSSGRDGDMRSHNISTHILPNVPDLLNELDQLRQRGILTDEEFQRKKTELLGKM
jgi:uncharacterized membrane protein YdbT with pleckstrin-like domain